MHRKESCRRAIPPLGANQTWARRGPRRHLAFLIPPKQKYLFVLNELHSTVTTFARDTRMGSLRELQTLSTLPNDFKGENTGADVHVSSDGRFLYSSNRGHDSIACFKIDPRAGSADFRGARIGRREDAAQCFAIRSDGRRFAGGKSKLGLNIVRLRRDQETGRLSSARDMSPTRASPVCLQFTTPFG